MPLSEYTRIYLCILLLMSICIIPSLWLFMNNAAKGISGPCLLVCMGT